MFMLMYKRRKSLCLLISFSVTAIIAREISLTVVTGGYNNKLLSEFDAFPQFEKELKFHVKGCKDSYVLLRADNTTQSANYRIIIGGWNNNRSVIHRITDKYIIGAEHYMFGKMNCNQYKSFWITWDKGTISVGRGNVTNVDVFMSFKDKCPFAIQDIEIATGQGATVDWVIQVQTEAPSSAAILQKIPTVKSFEKVWTCPTFYVIKMSAELKKEECAAVCMYTTECGGFNYDKNGVCKLVSDQVISANSSTYYKVFNIF